MISIKSHTKEKNTTGQNRNRGNKLDAHCVKKFYKPSICNTIGIGILSAAHLFRVSPI